MKMERKRVKKNGEINGAKKNTIEIAKKMKKANKLIDEIMEFTGLTKEEIEDLDF